MPDDKFPNDDLNPMNIPPMGGMGGINPEDFANINPQVDLPNSELPNPNAVDYDFAQMQGTPTNESAEVKIDPSMHEKEPVTVRPVEFTQFDSYTPTNTDTNKNLELLMDIKLELTVELGRCQLPVKKVLELTRGSIIELDKVAGESVELFANGKHVANGEVVVIEDNFGLRITSITDPQERIKSL